MRTGQQRLSQARIVDRRLLGLGYQRPGPRCAHAARTQGDGATHFKKVMAPAARKKKQEKAKNGDVDTGAHGDAAQQDGDEAAVEDEVQEMKEYLTPCSPGEPDAVEMTWDDIEGEQLLEPKLVMNDFLRAIQAVRPTVTKADSKYRRRSFLDHHEALADTSSSIPPHLLLLSLCLLQSKSTSSSPTKLVSSNHAPRSSHTRPSTRC